MTVVRMYQHEPNFGKAKVKENDTLVTFVDNESESRIVSFMDDVSGYAINAEENGSYRTGTKQILIDPLDGTRAFTNGLVTSTVIAAALDERNMLEACVIGEPISGRVWVASAQSVTTRQIYRYETDREADWIGSPTPTHPWKGLLDQQATVLLDVSHGFKTKRGEIFSHDHVRGLLLDISRTAMLLMAGSNGLHQALVANGGEKMAGAITTAVGGPWDVCGALLVLRAGGAARAFTKDSDVFHEISPLDVLRVDILVTGNSKKTVDQLVALLPLRIE